MPGAADTAKLIASLTLKDGFTGPLKTMDKGLSRFDSHLSKTQNRSLKAGQQIGTGIRNGAKLAAVGIGFLATQVAFGLDSLSKLEEADAQTEAAIKSTGGVARVTAKDVRTLAESYEGLNATIDDKVIQSAENLLLTFTNVRKEAFGPALGAILDMNTALGRGEGGLNQTVTQVGKALNDPIKGITALRKAGVLFTTDQIKQIKTLQESGDLLGAQAIILKELGTEFGGRFAAQGETATGTVAGIGDAIEDLQKTIASGLFPVIQKMLPKVRAALADPALIAGVSKLGDSIASLFTDANIEEGTRLIKSAFDTAKSVAPAIQRAAEVTGQVLKTAVDAFRSLPPEIQSLAIAGLAINKLTGGLVTNIAGGLISAVISSFRGLMNVNAAVVNVNGPVAGVPGGGGIPGAAPAAAGAAISGGAAGALVAAPIAIGAALGLATAEAVKGLGVAGGSNQRTLIEASKGDPKALEQLKEIRTQGDHTQDAIEKQRATALQAADRSVSAAERIRSAVGLTTSAVKSKDQTVTVNNRVSATTILNGRIVQASLERFTTKVDSGAPAGAFGGQ